jgi:peroxisomal membrane protein 4
LPFLSTETHAHADAPERFREKLRLVIKATRQHARNLAKFAVIYKGTMIAMKYLNPAGNKEGPYDTFVAGLLGGYVVFGRNHGSVSQQVCLRILRIINLPRNTD